MAIKTELTAGQYNSQAKDQGREDWNTAYRKDVLGLNDGPTPTQPTQDTGIVSGVSGGPIPEKIEPVRLTEQRQPTQEQQQVVQQAKTTGKANLTQEQFDTAYSRANEEQRRQLDLQKQQGNINITNQAVDEAISQPKWQTQLDKTLETKSIADTRRTLIQARDQGKISAEQYKATEAYLWQKVNETSGQISPEVFEEKPLGEEELFAQSKGIDYTKGADGKIIFNPTDLNQAIELYMQYGKNVTIPNKNIEAIKGSALFAKFGKYKGATADEYFNGLNTNELAVGGEAWNLITRLNGGVETPEMIEARQRYEKATQLGTVNQNNKLISDVFGGTSPGVESILTAFNERITAMDTAYMDKVESMFVDKQTAWDEYKAGTEKSNEIREQLNGVGSRIDELNTEKVNLLDDLKERHPTASLSRLLALARKETQAIDKQLFVEQREYTRLQSDYQYENEQNQAEFQFNMNMIDTQVDFLSQMYGIKRGDMKEMQGMAINLQLRQEDIQRQDELLAQEREQKEMEYQRAIERADFEFARNMKAEIAMLDYKQEINKGFQFLTPTSGVIARVNPATGDMEIVFDERGGGGGTIPANIAAQLGLSEGATTADYASNFRITQNYGDRSPLKDKDGKEIDNVLLANGKIGTPGLDLAMPNGTDVIAFTGGEVVKAWSTAGYGNQVVIKDENGNEHMYSHLSEGLPKVGDKVQIGDIIAKSGNSGSVLGQNGGYHLDYRVKSLLGQWLDPNDFAFSKPTETQSEGLPFNKYQEALFDKFEENKDPKKLAEGLGVNERVAEELYNIYSGQKDKPGYVHGIPFDAYRRVWANLPVKEKDNVAERKDIQNELRKMFETHPNLDPMEAYLMYKGVPLNTLPENQKDTYMSLYTSFAGAGLDVPDDFYTHLYNLFDRGAYGNAVARVENQILGDYKKQNSELGIDMSDVIKRQNELDRVIGRLDGLQSKVGKVAGTYTDLKARFFSETAFTELSNDLTGIMANTRRDYGGTAITPTEMEALKSFIGLDTKVQFDNLIASLKTLKTANLDQFNSIRQGLTLPTISYDNLGNWNSIVPLYKDMDTIRKGQTFEDILKGQPTGGSDFLNGFDEMDFSNIIDK